MKPYSLDDHWNLLASEYVTGQIPWVDRMFYRAAIVWLRWRLKRCRQKRKED